MTKIDYAFDFAVRLDELILRCVEGGKSPEQLQLVMRNAIRDLNIGGDLYEMIEEKKNETKT